MNQTKLEKEIQNNVWKYCPYRFDDPQTKIKDSCGLHDCHCVAIDSVFTHMNNKKSICKIYNDIVSKRRSQAKTDRKRCAICNKFFIPNSGRQKYCDICAKMKRRDDSRKWMQNNKAKFVN